MTEADWRTTTTQPKRMIRLVADASARRKRLAACGFCRLVWDGLSEVALAGLIPRYEREEFDARVDQLPNPQIVEWLMASRGWGNQMVESVRSADQEGGLAITLDWAERIAPETTVSVVAVRAAACDVLREVFGNPFQPRKPIADWLGGGWLAPDGTTCPVTPTARAIAGRIADEHGFADLPILADALDDIGCPDADVIHHLRNGPHHRPGCWALDLILGRG